jgi:23S rRNA (cytosine1962-C5)-methyltransferase
VKRAILSRQDPIALADFLRAAIDRRADLVARVHGESTDCYRLLHGVTEGAPGVTIDRYGPVLLIQTWRTSLTMGARDAIHRLATDALGTDLVPIWRSRGGGPAGVDAAGDTADYAAVGSPVGLEFGLAYDVRPFHRGQDPLLFLDLRAGRRRIRDAAAGHTVLNLFAYTGSIGLCAAACGADLVWNVDFAAAAIEVARANAARNGLTGDRCRVIRADVIPTVRQLAGLPVKGRAAHQRTFARFAPRQFDLVALDPPRWARGPFGAVDVVRDYPALFKPALLATRPGGDLLATNHAPEVDVADWRAQLERCAAKVGRPLAAIEIIAPEDDFPSFDARPPLKIAWVRVAD